MSEATSVYVVDDDESVRESLVALLVTYDFEVRSFASAGEFLAACSGSMRGCLIADIRMPDMDGLELQAVVASRHPDLQVVIITGHGDVPLAVRAMKAGAVDFIEKPFPEDLIIGTVRRAVELAAKTGKTTASIAEIRGRLDLLTAREREVLDGLVAGQPNKTIAYDLGISPRTVEIYRARVMDKMGARSLSELVRLAISGGIARG
jgi:two-component system response regulator FixJ